MASTAVQKQIDENQLVETTVFFSGGSHSLIHRALVPQSQFVYDQVDEMLEKHDNSTRTELEWSSHRDGGKARK